MVGREASNGEKDDGCKVMKGFTIGNGVCKMTTGLGCL